MEKPFLHVSDDKRIYTFIYEANDKNKQELASSIWSLLVMKYDYIFNGGTFTENGVLYDNLICEKPEYRGEPFDIKTFTDKQEE